MSEANEPRGRILVVDDEPSARMGLEKLLRHKGYRVQSEADGVAALQAAGEFAPDVVVTDLKMPKMDGIELLKRLREQDRDIPVIVATAFGEVASAVSAMRAGADDYELSGAAGVAGWPDGRACRGTARALACVGHYAEGMPRPCDGACP